MKYVIYAAVALLIAWAVWYVCRHLLRQVRGKGDCGCGCAGCPHAGSCEQTEPNP